MELLRQARDKVGEVPMLAIHVNTWKSVKLNLTAQGYYPIDGVTDNNYIVAAKRKSKG